MLKSMDWFKGNFTGKPHIKNGKIDGFRLRFSPTNQSIDWNMTGTMEFDDFPETVGNVRME